MWAGFVTAPKGVLLDSPEQIKLHARMIAINAVRSRAMPPGNVTEITPDERQVLAAWLAAGAPGNESAHDPEKWVPVFGRDHAPMKTSLESLNAASEGEFTAALADIYEHSPWVAKAAAARRPVRHARGAA